jgi:peptidoglycan hydrolase-like protein with peptidoglycan-binding domain
MATHVVRALGALVLASAAVLGGAVSVNAVALGAPPPSGPLGTPARPLSGAGSVGTAFISDDCTRTVLRYGSRGQCVVQLQMTLNVLFSEGLSFDGRYGPATTAAVYRVQARYGLAYDGICGPQTWAALVWAHEQARNGLPY